MAVIFEIDPVSEDATNTALTISSTPYRLREVDLTPPDIDPRYASSVDTEGELPVAIRHHNRHIILTLMITGTDVATNAAFETAMGDLVKKLMKLHREGGTLKMTTPAATTAVADVLTVNTKPTLDQLWPVRRTATIQIDFECRPYLRGSSSQLSDHVETTSPVLVFTEAGAGLTGDVPALGRLVLDNDQAGQDQFWLTWGIQSRYYDSAATAALFYEAEGRTPQNGAAVVTGPTGASGGASNNSVSIADVGPYPASMLSTQATGGGAHLSHVGRFRVWARIQLGTPNTGTSYMALEWGQGDLLRPQRNATVSFTSGRRGQWLLADLGLIDIKKVAQGTQRWEGRFLAWSDEPVDRVDIDYFFLVPADEGSGIVSGTETVAAPTAYAGRDEFDQTAGNLAGKAAALGGNWAGVGDTDDFLVEVVSATAQRTAVSDTGARVNTVGSSLTNTFVQCDFTVSNLSAVQYSGVVARFADVNNYLFARVAGTAGTPAFGMTLYKRVAGVETPILSTLGDATATYNFNAADWPLNTALSARLYVDARGNCAVWLWLPSLTTLTSNATPVMRGFDSALATGGALASGTAGIYDYHASATAMTRSYDNFQAWAPQLDAAVFASQSLEVRENQVLREDSTGSFWNRITPEGDYLLVPPGGKEARTSRFIAKMSRNDPAVGADAGIDDLSGRLTVIPRYLILPS